MRGGKAEKETKGGERERGEEGKGCRSFSHVCLTALCGGTEEKREVGIEGSRERERRGEERESLKHCLYAGKFWTTLLTSKCFHSPGSCSAYVCACAHVCVHAYVGV